jgi:hypothetical protein
VYTDFDKSVDFSKYKSFDYYIEPNTGLSELDQKRVKESIDSLLNSKNITQQTIPEFSINFYAEFYTVETENSIGVGLGTGGRNVGGSVSSDIPIRTQKDMIALTIEFVDALTKELFWQGVMERKMKDFKDPSERDVYISEIVSKILAEYPQETN